jgi:glycosyltransferase involved in cell wall biosynthesis
LVSVVIPAYNAGSFIERTLDSIRLQTYFSYEVVVVDDGSSDDTKSVVDAYLARHAVRGRCIRQTNKKIAAARNTGMRAAVGTYIALLDHDDLWEPQKLARVMREFETHPEVDLICHALGVSQNGKRTGIFHVSPAVPDMYERLLFSGKTLVSPSAAVFNREKALAIGGFDENPGFNTVEDYDFWMRFSRVARFHFIDEVLGDYLVLSGSASRQIDYHLLNLERLLHRHFSDYSSSHAGILTRMRIRNRLSQVHRAGLLASLAHIDSVGKQREYLGKMLHEFPIAPKNIAAGLLWLASGVSPRLTRKFLPT